jgi:hypothetical protein
MKKAMKVKVPVQDAWAGRAGSLPPPPAPLPELLGGGEGWRVRPCLGVLSREGGDLWQASRELKWPVFPASKFSGFLSRVNPAGCHGRFFWRVILAHLFRGFSWPMKQAGSKEKKSKRKERKMYTQ